MELRAGAPHPLLHSGEWHPCRVCEHKGPLSHRVTPGGALSCLCSHKECRGCLEPSPCPISSSQLGCPAKTNIGSKLLNFPGPSTHRAEPVLGQGPGWGCRWVPPSPAQCTPHCQGGRTSPKGTAGWSVPPFHPACAGLGAAPMGSSSGVWGLVEGTGFVSLLACGAEQFSLFCMRCLTYSWLLQGTGIVPYL